MEEMYITFPFFHSPISYVLLVFILVAFGLTIVWVFKDIGKI
jgi:hypothetical protein